MFEAKILNENQVNILLAHRMFFWVSAFVKPFENEKLFPFTQRSHGMILPIAPLFWFYFSSYRFWPNW